MFFVTFYIAIILYIYHQAVAWMLSPPALLVSYNGACSFESPSPLLIKICFIILYFTGSSICFPTAGWFNRGYINHGGWYIFYSSCLQYGLFIDCMLEMQCRTIVLQTLHRSYMVNNWLFWSSLCTQVLVRLVGADDHIYPNSTDVMQWLANSNLLEMIVDKLSPSVSKYSFSIHYIIHVSW